MYKDEKAISRRLGRFTLLHTMNLTILSFIYLSVLFYFGHTYLILNSSPDVSVYPVSPAEFALILIMFISIFSLINLPTLEITEIDEMEIYNTPAEGAIHNRLFKQPMAKTSLDKHIRLCFVIFITPIIIPLIPVLLSMVTGTQNPSLIIAVTILFATATSLFIFWLIDGYLVTLRTELIEDSSKVKQLFS